MFETIEKIRQKPEKVKKRIAFLTAFLFAGLIFVVWLSVIYPDFRKKQAREEEVSKLEPSPLEAFGESISGGFGAIGEEVSGFKELISDLRETATSTGTTTLDADISASTTEFSE